MNNNQRPTQADEYRELSSDLRAKDWVLAAIFTVWWAVNGIMIAWLVTEETLNILVLIPVGVFGVIMNFALNFHVWDITNKYRQQFHQLKKIQNSAGLHTLKRYR